jgi:hypothetical protein
VTWKPKPEGLLSRDLLIETVYNASACNRHWIIARLTSTRQPYGDFRG